MFFQGIVVADSGNKGNDWWQWNNKKKMQPLLAVSGEGWLYFIVAGLG